MGVDSGFPIRFTDDRRRYGKYLVPRDLFGQAKTGGISEEA